MFHVHEFICHLQDDQLRPTTIRAYRALLERLHQWCVRNGITSAGALRTRDMLRYLSELRKAGISPNQHAMAVTRLRKYFGFLERERRILASPMPDIPTRRGTGPSYPAVGRRQLDSAFSLLRGDTAFEIRARAILELAYSSALRPREIYSLRLGDIDFRRGLLAIRESKGNKDRVVPVGGTALAWIERYLKEVRPRYAREDSEDFMFLSHRTGRALGVKGVWWALREAFRRRGLAAIKPYSLRVSAATDLLIAGMNLFAISRLLGHAKLQTTQSYLRVETVELAKELSRKHPRNAAESQLHRRQRGRRHTS
jgi:integrase/recombinase XerD